MLETIIGTLTGPIGGALAGIVAVLGALVLGTWRGRAGERERRAGQDAKDYRTERGKIDDEISNAGGATDSERIAELREIAQRRRGKRPD